MIFICTTKKQKMRIFYYLSSCNTCKKIENQLSLDKSVKKIDIKKKKLTEEELKMLHEKVGNYEGLINKRAQLFKQRNIDYKKLEEKDFKNLLLEHYTFIKRPILIYDDKVFVGNSSKTILEAIKFINE